jgi:hypothetical protein
MVDRPADREVVGADKLRLDSFDECLQSGQLER